MTKQNIIIAVDFDGTCVKHEYPNVGADVPHAVRVLKRLTDSGVRIIAWTMRCGEHLDIAVRDWYEKNEIEAFGFNTNPEQDWSNSPKCYAQLYIDDAALGCPLIYPKGRERPYVDWLKIEEMLVERGILK